MIVIIFLNADSRVVDLKVALGRLMVVSFIYFLMRFRKNNKKPKFFGVINTQPNFISGEREERRKTWFESHIKVSL